MGWLPDWSPEPSEHRVWVVSEFGTCRCQFRSSNFQPSNIVTPQKRYMMIIFIGVYCSILGLLYPILIPETRQPLAVDRFDRGLIPQTRTYNSAINASHGLGSMVSLPWGIAFFVVLFLCVLWMRRWYEMMMSRCLGGKSPHSKVS